jgi:hypothetical protein
MSALVPSVKQEWQDGIPANTAQEWMSLAYVQAAAAQAGLNTLEPVWDDGIDLLVGATKELMKGKLPANSWIALQIKSTQEWTDAGTAVRYFLRQKAWEKCRSRSNVRKFLVLYTMCSERHKWFSPLAGFGILRHAAYCLPVTALPTTCKKAGVVIEFPRDSLLTAQLLIKHVYESNSTKSGGAA